MSENRLPVSRRRAAATMLGFAWEADRTRSIVAFVLVGVQALAQSLFALWLKFLVEGLQSSDADKLALAAAGMPPRSRATRCCPTPATASRPC